jgi:hypothetical protein
MSDPQRPIGKTPPRAEPLQPDKPGAGDGKQAPADGSSASRDDIRRREEQERTAVENVREGYD